MGVIAGAGRNDPLKGDYVGDIIFTFNPDTNYVQVDFNF